MQSQARRQKLQLGGSFVQNCGPFQQNSGLFNKFVVFSNKIVDLFDKFVAFSNKIVDLFGKIVDLLFERGGSFAPRELPWLRACSNLLVPLTASSHN